MYMKTNTRIIVESVVGGLTIGLALCGAAVALALILAALSGCHGAIAPTLSGSSVTPASVAKTMVSITSIPYLGVLAMSGAVFIAFMGNPKLGMAVGAAGAAALALSLAVIKYAWILGLLSVAAMIGCGVVAVISNRRFKIQLVQGAQNVKDVVSAWDVHKSVVNRALTATQTPDVTAQVLKIKEKLELQERTDADKAAEIGG
jgi:hypothetical protein